MNSNQQRWFAVSITVSSDGADAVEAALNELDALGTEINNLRRSKQDDATVTGYFEEESDVDILSRKLAEFLEIYSQPSHSIKNIENSCIENTDWLSEWKKHWKPTEAGRFIVAPPWAETGPSDRTVIHIEPAMAFGTGTHETTRLCLQAISSDLRTGESFLDVGTGTGILAIAAAKIGRGESPIFGCDTDFDSITNARENAEMNDVSDLIEFSVDSISSETPVFDFVCANLTLDVITPILPLLVAKSRRILILSGILREQEPAVLAELEQLVGSTPRVQRMGEWISVTIDRP